MGTLDGKVAIVTGGTSGIGERIAELFVEEGASVVVAARRQQEGDALAGRLGLLFVRTDVAIEAEVKAMVASAVQRFGRIDCLVNNAALGLPRIAVAEIDTADFDQLMAVDVRGVFLGIKHVAPVMQAQGSGSIINIASLAALRGGFSGHAYCAAKGAVQALTRSVAAELGEKGIRVNSISPGGIVTGIFGKAAGVEGEKAERVADVVSELFATIQPIPRAGTTEDIARACVYLAGDGSSFVNGHDLVIDGGLASAIGIGAGWSQAGAFRAGLAARIKEAAEKL
jgi:NAD(P)-dependent dehydrogenase (short-subunit alcohol dehydrogenase family)